MKGYIVLLAVALALVVSPHPAAADEPVTAIVVGPTAIAPSTTHMYNVTVTGGPAVNDGTFEISYVLQGTNLKGGDPQVARTLANRQGKFTFNVTAPEVEGTVQLYVKAKSGNATGNLTTETRLWIDVFRPIELRATIRNNGAAAALNVTVLFYVDGREVGNVTVARIDAGGQTEVDVSFIPADLAIGRHTLKVTADVDKDGVIEPAEGELQQVDFFWRTEKTSTPAIFATITVFLLGFLVLILLAIRRQRRQGS
ncbi:MAG TPA: CARDB domain-containing protein [Thermoplasmata archaeon]|jgi:hypothetical protein|nr:CARDB domain-containing protein [Thermoplasmata archaeon]